MECIVLTGSKGKIGKAISKKLKLNGFRVIGIDKKERDIDHNDHIKLDLSLIDQKNIRQELKASLRKKIGDDSCIGLINNAAVQCLNSLNNIKIDEFNHSINVNLTAPLTISKILQNDLKKNKGCIINIGSIHSRLTKPKFISYATTKAGLEGLTRSLAVDIGNTVRVNMISPAAIDTPMLRASFNNNNEAYNKLEKFHPTNSIGHVDEIALIILSILNRDLSFLNGSIINLDGGIGSRLHDPN